MHRSDGSGTTFNFTDYLSKVSPEWKSKVGEGTSVSWPNGVGGKGNPGVASYVQQVDGAIGYVEFAYVIENKLIYTDMVNKAGKRLSPTMDAFQAAAANADFSKVQDFYLDPHRSTRGEELADHGGDLHAVAQGQPSRSEPPGA